MVVVDAGNALLPSVRRELDAEGQAALAEVMAKDLAIGGLDAMAVGRNEWALGAAELQALVERHELPVLAANLSCDPGPQWPGSTVVERGGRRLGIIGITDSVGLPSECTATDPAEAVARELAQLGEVDVVVLLSPLRGREVLTFPGVDVYVDGGSGRRYEVPMLHDGSWVLSAGSRGKYAAVAELEWVEGGTGWTAAGQLDVLDHERQRLVSRLASARERLETPTAAAQDAGSAPERQDGMGPDPARRAGRYQRQVDRFEAELADLDARIEIARSEPDGPLNRIHNRPTALSDAIADDPASLEVVTAWKASAGVEQPAHEPEH